jgi:hypothetical protein
MASKKKTKRQPKVISMGKAKQIKKKATTAIKSVETGLATMGEELHYPVRPTSSKKVQKEIVINDGDVHYPARPTPNVRKGFKTLILEEDGSLKRVPAFSHDDEKVPPTIKVGDDAGIAATVELYPPRTEAQQKADAIEAQRRVDLKVAIRKTITDYRERAATRLTELSTKVEDQLKAVIAAVSEVAVAKRDFDLQLVDLEDTLKVVCGLEEDVDPVELGIDDTSDDGEIYEMFKMVDGAADLNDIDFVPVEPEKKVTDAVDGALLGLEEVISEDETDFDTVN